MERGDKAERWRRWHEDVCAQFPQVRGLTVESWPTGLAIAIEDVFADQSLTEPERLTKAEREVLTRYASGASGEAASEIEACLAEAIRLQVQDAFERWKVDASAG